MLLWAQQQAGPSPGFLARTLASETARIEALATADLTADGRLDVVVAEKDTNSLAWYNCTGDPLMLPWTRTEIYTGIQAPNAIVLHDLDRDGDIDLAALGTAPEGAVWLENLRWRRPHLGGSRIAPEPQWRPRADCHGPEPDWTPQPRRRPRQWRYA